MKAFFGLVGLASGVATYWAFWQHNVTVIVLTIAVSITAAVGRHAFD